MRLLIVFLTVIGLCSCGMPKPPMVSGNNRVPVNKGITANKPAVNVFHNQRGSK